MRYYLMILGICFHFVSYGQKCPDLDNDIDYEALSLEELSEIYKEDRQDISSCDKRWNSNFHQIMIEIGSQLSKGSFSKVEVIQYLGVPDFAGQEVNVLSIEDSEEVMIYFWRGWHDWLYFIVENEQVKKVDWWFAYE